MFPRAPLTDCHTHTAFSDGISTFEENVRAAADAGCRVLVATDHLTVPAPMDPACAAAVPASKLAERREAFDRAREYAAEIAPDLEFIYGFECDWYDGCEPLVETWSAGAIVRLGSVHWLGDTGDIHSGGCDTAYANDAAIVPAGQHGSGSGWIDDVTDLHIWHELGPDEIWRQYVRTWCRACESPLSFDTMAHPDLPTRFTNEGLVPTIDLAPLWDEMVACAHDTGRRVELSTAAWRKGLSDYYPARGLLERFARAGVPITFGSDAHQACDICWGIPEAMGHAMQAGYRTFDAPHADGSWETYALE